MTPEPDAARLRHMLSHSRELISFCSDRERADLDADRVLSLALVRLMEIVGEAAARVSPSTQQQLPQIPWPQIVGLRNRLIHGYDSVDHDILWDIVQLDLPPLVQELQRVLAAN